MEFLNLIGLLVILLLFIIKLNNIELKFLEVEILINLDIVYIFLNSILISKILRI